jgi:hypothetical protein
LVTVNSGHDARIRQIATDVVRWRTEQVKLESHKSSARLKDALGEQVLSISADADDRPQLVSWKIQGSSDLGPQPVPKPTAEALTKWLRHEFSDIAPAVWTVSLEIEPPTRMPGSWQKEETILGSFLRTIYEIQNNPDRPIELEAYLSKELAESLSGSVSLSDAKTRRKVIREATTIGVNLLRGHEAP